MKYVQLNSDKRPVAFYDPDIHAGSIPTDAIEITDEQWLAFLADTERTAWDAPSRAVVTVGLPAPTTAQLHAHVNRTRDEKLQTTRVGTNLFDTDERSLTLINGAVAGVQAGSTSPVKWRMSDNKVSTFQPTDFVSTAMQILQRFSSVYSFSWQLKADIEAGKIASFADIDNATWP